MASVLPSIAVAILTFAAGVLGLYLHKLLPEQHSVDKSREMIGSVIGLVTLLLALVLGTIVGSAYYFSATQQTELQTLAARSLLLDKALAQYGPETKPVRDRTKDSLVKAYDTFWRGGDADPDKLTVATAMTGLQPMEEYLGSLDPKTPAQKQAVSTAVSNFGQIEQTRLMMSLQLANPFSRPLLIVVVFWSLFLFCGFGLLSQANATTLAALAFGAIAVASAIFLILELSQPYTGLFRTSPAALEQTIDAIDR
jgi:low affinity Fe/Cu permease